MMSSGRRPTYLHPNYNYYEQQDQKLQERNWNNSVNSNNYNNYCVTKTYEPSPLLSPLGLKEVLSSYTPGPTVIMIEKKKQPSFFDHQNLRIACLLIIGMLGCYILRSSLYSSHDDKPFLELTSPGGVAPVSSQTKDEPIASATNFPSSDDNYSGYTYLNNHFKYSKVILSLDDDDESLVEDIHNFTFL